MSMTSTKRERPESYETESKKAKFSEAEPSEPQRTKQRVVLNPVDCDLDFIIEGDGLQGSGLYEHGFAYCWSGGRANMGITGGKYYFGCKVIFAQPVLMEDTPLDLQHICRIGISRGDDKIGDLGETVHSFGYGGTGKFSNGGKFSDYGEKYDIGDTILCAVDLETKPMASISFAKNGKWLGKATHFNASLTGIGPVNSPVQALQWSSAVFPHVLLKNVAVRLQFNSDDGLVCEEGYRPWASALEDGNAVIGPAFSNMQDCEVIMMVGLPASGKTTWAEKWVTERPEKRYILLGTNLALDQMKVPGLLRKHNYGERFDRLIDRATGIFNTLLSRASKTARNFIIDQTNVYKSARKRKLKPFAKFHKIAVVVFPTPEELKFRAEKRFKEMGKEVPAEAVNEMIANFILPETKDIPGTDEYFDEAFFTELNRDESQIYLDEMKASLHLNPGLSPYPRGNFVQSYNSPSMYAPAPYSREGSFQSFGSPSGENFIEPYKNTLVQNRSESSVQSYNSLSLQCQSMSSGGFCQSPHLSPTLLASSYGNDQRSGNFLPRDDLNRRLSYSACDQSRRSDFDARIAPPVGFFDPYQSNLTSGAGPNYYASDSRRSFSSQGAPTHYQNGPFEPYVSNSSGSYSRYGGGPKANPPPSMQLSNLPPVPVHVPYGYRHETPSPRPSYGNYSTSAPQHGVYAPPRSSYY